ncbi:MAG: aminotransferase class V-fold PLP-dependent enzyme [Planctomycetota bacterium]
MIYLDHAATSFPKPPEVVEAVRRWFLDVGVSAERGDGPTTAVSADAVRRCREGVARRTGHRAERVAFCSGATEGLNLALRALVDDGCRVATTWFEHSSVVRPLHALCAERRAEVSRVESVEALCSDLERGCYDLVVMTHASNVTGEVFDAAAVAASAQRAGCRLVLDASQTAGYLPLDVGADVVVASAHKALHGPPGLGFVSVVQDLTLAPQKHGGTGSSAALDRHPTEWPTAFEAGTPNTPALFGLAAALEWLDARGEARLLRRARAPIDTLRERLGACPRVTTLGAGAARSVPVLSLQHSDYDPLELGGILSGAGFHVRAGHHCAPWIHERLGTEPGGTLRVSTGPETSDADVIALADVIEGL